MKEAITATYPASAPAPLHAGACPEAISARTRLLDFVGLTKPRIALMVLFTVAAGYLLAAGSAAHVVWLFHALLGTALVAGGASALNQWIERHSDARMRRTANRALPAGRLQPLEVVVFGVTLGVVGVAYLALTLPKPGAALVAAITFVLYVGVYTPLKAWTELNTLVGAVPGALPPVIGWVAARGTFDAEAVALFLILFWWQLPHFFAIAWMYRTEYRRAGLRMLSAADRTGAATAWYMIGTCVGLMAASLLPVFIGKAGAAYLAGAILLGLGFLYRTECFRRERTDRAARRVLRASLVYLPGLLAFLLLDGALPRLFAF